VDSLVFNAAFDEAVFQRPLTESDYRFPSETDSVQVPFNLVGGHIYLPGTVNGRRLTFILDSGASANIFHRPALDGLSLPTVGKLPATGVAGWEMVDLIRTDSLVIGGLVMLNQVGGALDLSLLSGSQLDSVPFGGVLGYDFLSRFPLLIDYQKELLTIYSPESFEAPSGGHEVPFELTLQVPTVNAELVGFPGRYLIDLGNPFGLIVHQEFSQRNGLSKRLDDVQDMAGSIGGIGGGLAGKTAHAATFSLGDIRMNDIQVMLPDSGSGLAGSVELAGNIGNQLLGRFRVLFDYRAHRLIFYE
ncbi:MAG: retropepsin-like aspartic protease, partial [candidate division Zixibacteria bacterium]|nr:retropepsin-like aspartic protease [candidate division Zixibacteria bacterium]